MIKATGQRGSHFGGEGAVGVKFGAGHQCRISTTGSRSCRGSVRDGDVCKCSTKFIKWRVKPCEVLDCCKLQVVVKPDLVAPAAV